MARRRFRVLLLATCLAILAPISGYAGPGEPAPDDGRVIVIFRADAGVSHRDFVVRRAGAFPERHFRSVAATAAHLPSPGIRPFLEQHPDVVAVIPDRPMRIHAKPGGAPGGGAKQVVPAGVARIGAAPGALAWTGAGVGVAVVDTGLDFAHADLQPLGLACFTAYASCQDDNRHGTHVGGIVAARNNTRDVVGVAPDVVLYAVKVLDAAGDGSDSTVMAGLDWVAHNAANLVPAIRVVNMSLGRPGTLGDNPALRALVQTLHSQGITVVVSAGNDQSTEVSQQVPATYPEVLAVASATALDGSNSCRFLPGAIRKDTASWFTTDGAFDPSSGIGVTISAPGEDKENVNRGCFVQSVGILSTRLGGGTTRLQGTSMAAPHVAGVVALLWEKALFTDGTLDPETARSAIRSKADRRDQAPFDSPVTSYTFDGEREGILWAPGALN